MYRVGNRQVSKRRRIIFWLIILILLLLLFFFGIRNLRRHLKPNTTIKQAAAVSSTANFNSPNKNYQEPDFTITIPSAYVLQPKFNAPYLNYTWSTTTNKGTNAQSIAVYEDSNLVSMSVNRALVVVGQRDHLTITGTVSDNCSKYTLGANLPNITGAPAKWEGVNFLCDQRSTERNLVGTSSLDGINAVNLMTSSGVTHKFLFTYTDNSLSPDYTAFLNALTSLAMR